MIQRIQTLYLLLVVVLGSILLFVPVIQLVTPEDAAVQRMAELSATGIHELTQTGEAPLMLQGIWGLLLATVLIPVLALVDIFLFKKLSLQARLNIFLAALCIAYYAVIGVYVWFAGMNLGMEWHLTPWACIPLLCLVLTVMATRRILGDIALLRAADRIR